MIYKRNALRKAIDELKKSTTSERPELTIECTEREQAFNGASRSYRVNRRPKMEVDTFFSRIREDLIELIKRELTVLNSARAQTTT